MVKTVDVRLVSRTFRPTDRNPLWQARFRSSRDSSRQMPCVSTSDGGERHAEAGTDEMACFAPRLIR